jgi:hypothetical protein
MMWFLAERCGSAYSDRRKVLVEIVLKCMESLPSYPKDPCRQERKAIIKAIRAYVEDINPFRSVKVAIASNPLWMPDQELGMGYHASNIVSCLCGIICAEYGESHAYFAINNIAQALSYRKWSDCGYGSTDKIVAEVKSVRLQSLRDSADIVRSRVPKPPTPKVVYRLSRKENRCSWFLCWLNLWRWRRWFSLCGYGAM